MLPTGRGDPLPGAKRAPVSGRHPGIARAGLEGSRGRHREARAVTGGVVTSRRARREPRTGRGGSVRAVRHGSTHPPNSRQGAPSPPRTATNRGCGRRRPRDAPRILAPRIAKTRAKDTTGRGPDVRARSVGSPGDVFVFAPARCGRSGGGGAATRGRDVQRVSPSVRRRATRFRRGRRATRTRGSTTETRRRRAGRRRTRRRRRRVDARDVLRLSLNFVRLERAARWRAGLVLPGSKTAFACFSPPPRSSSFPTRRSSNTGSVRSRGTFARPEARGRFACSPSEACARRRRPRWRRRFALETRRPHWRRWATTSSFRALIPRERIARAIFRRRRPSLGSTTSSCPPSIACRSDQRGGRSRRSAPRAFPPVDRGRGAPVGFGGIRNDPRATRPRDSRRATMDHDRNPRAGGSRVRRRRARRREREDVAGDGDGDTRRRRRAAPRRRRVTPSFGSSPRAAPFGSSRALWHDAVLRPLRERRSEGIATLRRTLSRLLVRASKAELGLLPPPTRRAVRVPFAPSHARARSTNSPISCGSICTLADWNDPEHQESLLHRHRAQYARELYVNVRKACSLAGAIRVAPQEHDLCETLTLLARRRGLPTPVAWDFTLRTDEDVDRDALVVVAGAEGLPANVASFAYAANETNGTMNTNAGAGSYSAATVRERGEERARRTEGERGRRAGAHLPGGVVSDASPPWLPETHPLSRVETALREGGACASCSHVSSVVSCRRADAAWCVLRAPSRARRGARRAGRPTTCSPRTIPIARFITIVRNGPCRTNSSSGNPRAWAPTRWDTGADTGRRIGDRRRVPKCRG